MEKSNNMVVLEDVALNNIVGGSRFKNTSKNEFSIDDLRLAVKEAVLEISDRVTFAWVHTLRNDKTLSREYVDNLINAVADFSEGKDFEAKYQINKRERRIARLNRKAN